MSDITKMAGDFIKELGWFNPKLEWRESSEIFVVSSATTAPHESEKYNELFRMYRAGKESVQEKLKNTTELEDENKKLKALLSECCDYLNHPGSIRYIGEGSRLHKEMEEAIK